MRDFPARRVTQFKALRGREPLKVLHDLRCFNGNRHSKVLRSMELIPVAFGCEMAQSFAQILQAVQAGSRGLGGFCHGICSFGSTTSTSLVMRAAGFVMSENRQYSNTSAGHQDDNSPIMALNGSK